jgi:hypothetical protein
MGELLVIKTAEGDREVLRHRNGYIVFQLAHAIEAAIREATRQNGLESKDRAPNAREFRGSKPQPDPRPVTSFGLGI